jgi:demethylmenaquinone methyltransferase/2-methoxy-6-polyprenyl-1,4-benzoquinol methylase
VNRRHEPTTRAIDAQKRYYDLRAPDYLTGVPADRGTGASESTISPRECRSLVDELRPVGEVLELACGPGGFTRELARHARSVTAIDASPQMLARNRLEVGAPNVRYVEADLFAWEPDTPYDVVFFGFFLSHVPPAAFESFWEVVRASLRAGGRVAFVDEDDRAAERDEVQLLEGVPMARRRLGDGREFDIVKVFWNPDDLAARLRDLDWDIGVRRLDAGLFFGVGVDTRA